jgi:hypothetical protein
MPLSSSTSSSNEVLKLARRVLLLVVLLFALDRIGGALAAHWFARTRDGDTGESINSLLQQKSEVVVFGDSRAESHYAPALLAEELGATAFNGGYKGSNTIYDYGLEQLLFDSYTPKLIVLDFSEFSLMKTREDPYLKLAPLHPYWRDPGLWQVIGEGGRLAQLYFLSHLYPYNSKLHSIVLFNLVAGRAHASNGFEPQFGSMGEAAIGPLSRKPVEYSDLLVSYGERFLVCAHEHHVPIVIVMSPRYAQGTFRIPPQIQRRIEEFSIPVIDYSVEQYPQFADYRLYRDVSHLNKGGAEAFSRLLGEELCKRYCETLRARTASAAGRGIPGRADDR